MKNSLRQSAGPLFPWLVAWALVGLVATSQAGAAPKLAVRRTAEGVELRGETFAYSFHKDAGGVVDKVTAGGVELLVPGTTLPSLEAVVGSRRYAALKAGGPPEVMPRTEPDVAVIRAKGYLVDAEGQESGLFYVIYFRVYPDGLLDIAVTVEATREVSLDGLRAAVHVRAACAKYYGFTRPPWKDPDQKPWFRPTPPTPRHRDFPVRDTWLPFAWAGNEQAGLAMLLGDQRGWRSPACEIALTPRRDIRLAFTPVGGPVSLKKGPAIHFRAMVAVNPPRALPAGRDAARVVLWRPEKPGTPSAAQLQAMAARGANTLVVPARGRDQGLAELLPHARKAGLRVMLGVEETGKALDEAAAKLLSRSGIGGLYLRSGAMVAAHRDPVRGWTVPFRETAERMRRLAGQLQGGKLWLAARTDGQTFAPVLAHLDLATARSDYYTYPPWDDVVLGFRAQPWGAQPCLDLARLPRTAETTCYALLLGIPPCLPLPCDAKAAESVETCWRLLGLLGDGARLVPPMTGEPAKRAEFDYVRSSLWRGPRGSVVVLCNLDPLKLRAKADLGTVLARHGVAAGPKLAVYDASAARSLGGRAALDLAAKVPKVILVGSEAQVSRLREAVRTRLGAEPVFPMPPDDGVRVHIAPHSHGAFWTSAGECECQRRWAIIPDSRTFARLKHWPGLGVSVKLPVFDLEEIRRYYPQTFEDLRTCVEVGAVELSANGFIDYPPRSTPLANVKRHYEKWADYVAAHFGHPTTHTVASTQEVEYHQRLPEVFEQCGIIGVLYGGGLEPTRFLSEDGDASTVCIHYTRKRTTLEAYKADGLAHAKKTGFKFPNFTTLTESPNGLPVPENLLTAIRDDPVVSISHVSDYIRRVPPRKSTTYRVFGDSGWIEGDTMDVYLNGLSWRAFCLAQQARFLMAHCEVPRESELRDLFDRAEEHGLRGEKSMARRHGSAVQTRKWAELNSLVGAEWMRRVIQRLGPHVSRKMGLGDKPPKLPGWTVAGRAVVANPLETARDDRIALPLPASARGAKGVAALRPDGTAVPSQVVSGEAFLAEGGGPTLLVRDGLKPHSLNVYYVGVREGATAAGASSLRVELTRDAATMENGLVRVRLDARRGGTIAEFIDTKTGKALGARGGAFSGLAVDIDDSRNVELAKFRNTEITDAASRAELQVIARGPLLVGVRATTKLMDGCATRVTDYYLEDGKRDLEVWCRMTFDELTWFAPGYRGYGKRTGAYHQSAKFRFEAAGPATQEAWNIPGGMVNPRPAPKGWHELCTMGLIELSGKEGGVAIASGLHPNGIRRMAVEGNAIDLLFSAALEVNQGYSNPDTHFGVVRHSRLVGSHGASDYRFVLIPFGSGDRAAAERRWRTLNFPCIVYPMRSR